MPTNLLRRKFEQRPARATALEVAATERIARLTAGRVSLSLKLLDTRTASLIWSALPLFSIAETWGESLHFDTPLKTGRERTARINAAPGDVCFWVEDERVVIAWGPTPISGANEIRLMRPCNIWALTLDDPARLASVTPGEKVSLTRAQPAAS